MSAEEIQLAQITIGRALLEARGGEDREVTQTVRDLGEHLVRVFHGLMRLTRMHAADNAVFGQPTADMVRTLQRLYDLLGVTHLVCVEGLVYVNDVRVRIDERSAIELGEELARHGCGGLTFDDPLDAEQVRALCDAIAVSPADAGDAGGKPIVERFRARLRDAALDPVSASGMHRFIMSSDAAARLTDPKAIVRRAGVAVAECFDNLFVGRLPNPIPVRRAVIGLIEIGDGAMIASADIDPTLPVHARHAVRVTAFCLRLGLDLGLADSALADLGVAAMVHDVGYADRVDGLPPEHAQHPSTGARVLLRQRGFHQAKIKRILAAVEHHRPYSAAIRPGLYARIIHIADDYETLTRERRPSPFASPPQALSRMHAAAGQEYDPVLMQVFLNAVGPFPPGTRLRLADGRVVVSVSGSRGQGRFGKPLCRVLRFADGRVPPELTYVDLATEGKIIGLG